MFRCSLKEENTDQSRELVSATLPDGIPTISSVPVNFFPLHFLADESIAIYGKLAYQMPEYHF